MGESSMRMVKILCIICVVFATPAIQAGENRLTGYAGSLSCRECHEKFYQLWSTSMHGLAMQPYTPAFAASKLTPQENEITIDKTTYRADIVRGVVIEADARGKRSLPIVHVLGGKNVYYLLTAFGKGRLQTLPVAYDVNKKKWFDMAASGIRHFPGERHGEAVSWKESPYTFNTSCYSCHVSQLSTNYDPETDTYNTTWAEPGINCETCHGPSAEHNRIARAAPRGQPLAEPGIISTRTMTKQQRNDLCLSCHAKVSSLTRGYVPEERFFDHFDLVTLEDPDYYPDGRDLGENYTFTSWNMSPCVKSGQLDCMHCHTSSGRYRFKNEKFNNACLPCHENKLNNIEQHTHHAAESEASRCISCHMPMSAFARMNRSDHSMLPPTPAASKVYNSPNACNICHQDKTAAWADAYVRQWRARDFQAPLLQRAALVESARKRDWSKLPEMLTYIQSKDRDEIFAASLIRLMNATRDERVLPALLVTAKDPSPLIRAASIEAISLRPFPEGVRIVLQATADEYRLVRMRAAAGLAGLPIDRLPEGVQKTVQDAGKEYLAGIMARPDQWTSHYNLGNYHLGRGEPLKAVSSYRAALEREPKAVMAMVNSSIAFARAGENDKAEKALQDALRLSPDNASANFNMGLMEAEKSNFGPAEKYLKEALKADPRMAQAAYNLCVVMAGDRLDEAITWCRKAVNLNPEEPRYASTLAYYLDQKGNTDEAIMMLRTTIERYPEHRDPRLLLEQISGKENTP